MLPTYNTLLIHSSGVTGIIFINLWTELANLAFDVPQTVLPYYN